MIGQLGAMSALSQLAPTIASCISKVRDWEIVHDVTDIDTTAMCITQQGLGKLHHVARAFAKESRGFCRMTLQTFLHTLAPLFALATTTAGMVLIGIDSLVCLLHDCHGIHVGTSEWEDFKKQLSVDPSVFDRQPVWTRKRSQSQTFSDASDGCSGGGNGRSCLPRSSSSRSSFFGTGTDTEPFNSSSSSCRSRSLKQDESDGSYGDLAKQNQTLAIHNKLLRQMLCEKDGKLIAQQKMLKQARQKASRAEKLAAQLADRLKAHKTKSQQFEPTRVKGDKILQKQVRRLADGRIEQFLQNDFCQSDDDGADGIETENGPRGTAGWLTPQGSISLAIRRNLGNVSAQDLGLIIMNDVSKQTVLRSECRTAAALAASNRFFFEEWLREDRNRSLDSHSFFFLQYREDATNAAKHRQKMTALEYHASWAITTKAELNHLDSTDFQSVRRLADVLPVWDGSGKGTLALTKKMLESMGVPSWDFFISEYNEATPHLEFAMGREIL